MPIDFKYLASPIPETWSKCGEPIAPAHKIISLFAKISNRMKYNKPPIFFKDRPNEVRMASCSSEKSRKMLGYKTSINLDESLNKLIDYIQKGGPKEFKYGYKLEIENDVTPDTWKNKYF